MRHPTFAKALLVAGSIALGLGAVSTASAQKTGGILNFVVGSKIPSYDAHRETTFGMVHPLAPFYSVLIRVNPENPQSATDFVCDLCVGGVPKPTNDGKTYTFKIRDNAKWHDGDPVTAHDVAASFNNVIFPKEGVPSARKAFFRMVKSVTAPDDSTVVFDLEFPSGAFIPAVAGPQNWIYKKAILDKDGTDWYAKNVMGSGPFIFVTHEPGSYVEGKKNPDYHHKGQPYLDGFKAVAAPKMALRTQAIRSNRAAIEFRGFPPKARDDLVKALGDKITVQESDWNCVLLSTPNQKVKPYDDPKVRQALTLAVDRWGGSKYLSNIAIVKSVGGVVFPSHPLAATKEEMTKLMGYGEDMAANREMAKKLLKEAGHENLKFTLHNRGVDQPYKVVGTWLVDQYRKVGMDVDQRVQPTTPFYATLRKKKDFDVSIDFNCQSVINPISDVTKFLGSAGNNYGQYDDQPLEDIYNKLLRSGDEAEQRTLMREYETRAISDQAHIAITLWWYKINPHRSYVKGWKIAPSHYLNQQLDNVWLD